MWRQNGVRIRGVGGRPRPLADGRAAEGKAIWVIKGAFFDNEMGLLTNNDPQNSLVVERSQFGRG